VCHSLPLAEEFYEVLRQVDLDLAGEARAQGCLSCGDRLHRADYDRKPRGGPEGLPAYVKRFSFCCQREGCRRRLTPPSVRFLGRRVYLATVVVLVAVLRHGLSPGRVDWLHRVLGVSRRTLGR